MEDDDIACLQEESGSQMLTSSIPENTEENAAVIEPATIDEQTMVVMDSIPPELKKTSDGRTGALSLSSEESLLHGHIESDFEHSDDDSVKEQVEAAETEMKTPTVTRTLEELPAVRPVPNSASKDKYTIVESASHSSNETLKVLALPIDTLHCVASFLSANEWSNFGMTCKRGNKVCAAVFRRVRMHGFRCAAEIATAWALGEHADARELAALYIHAGVPVYPRCMGHSYHTVCWRMNVEAAEMEGSENGNEEEQTRTETSDLDVFYSDRYNSRAREGNNPWETYLEEKCRFWLQKKHVSQSPSQQLANPRWTELLRGANSNGFVGSLLPLLHHPATPAGGDQTLMSNAFRSQAGLRSSGVSPLRASGYAESESANLFPPKIAVNVHQHLQDQFLFRKASVGTSIEDEDGILRTPPMSLAVDFFHLSNGKARQLEMTEVDRLQYGRFSSDEDMVGSWGNQAASSTESDSWIERRGEEDLSDNPSIQEELLGRTIGGTARTDGEAEPPRGASVMLSPIQQQEDALVGDFFWTLGNILLNLVDLDVYSSSTASTNIEGNLKGTTWKQLVDRISDYQGRLEKLLNRGDDVGFDEVILDFWDEFFPLTASIHYFDRHTAVPRVSKLHKFLTQPCPKAIGVVQCEIERIKISSKRKGVSMKGRLFPTYEYRLFIRDREHGSMPSENGTVAGEEGDRRDTVLMVAKNKGRKHIESSPANASKSFSSKKGSNNYYLYMPQQSDLDIHFNKVNETEVETVGNSNGANHSSVAEESQMLLGRLQSNFIGTEFQIFTPRVRKRSKRPKGNEGATSYEEETGGYDSGAQSDDAASTASRRRSRFIRLKSGRRRNSTPSNPAGSERKWQQRMKRGAIANTVEPAPSQESALMITEEEDGVITYTANLLGSRPRIMDVCVPKVALDGSAGVEWRRFLEDLEGTDDLSTHNRMLNCFRQLQQRLEAQLAENPENTEITDDFGLIALQNRPPWWNIELGSFVLNFRGRVSVASVKNFQLCDRNDHDHIMLQFGRIQGRHSFTMDFQYPLTAVQAFSIAISSLQSKISFG